jgi:serralysin
MAFDIAAIQLMYGAAASNAGNTVYTLRDDAVGASYSCIWDTGGIDTIQYAGSRDATIDLRAASLANGLGGGGFLSSVDGVAGGFTIAADVTDFDRDGNFGVVIENAIGGSGGDTLIGNAASNRLEGGAGSDELYGRGGLDMLIGGADDDNYLLDDVARISAGGMLVGEGYDTVVEAAGEGEDTVWVGHVAGSLLDHTHYTLPDNVERRS